MKNNSNRHDYYFNKAKKEGYPARSVYKLREIDKKFNLIKQGDNILDIGSSPGSWLLYLSKKVGKKGNVCGVDLKETQIDLPDNANFIKKDVFLIKPEDFKLNEFDVIVSDLAPKTSGVKITDAARSLRLNQKVLELAEEFLKKDGHLVLKIFDGEDVNIFIKILKKNFESVRRYIPKATRKKSREIYIVCKSFLKND